MAKFPERVFSGVQPTGNLHLGNYLGAIKRFVAHAGDASLHLLRRRSACDDHAARAGAASAHHARGDRGLSRLRHRPEGQYRLQPEPGRRACRARLGVRLRRPARLAQPHDPVQGEGGQGPGERVDRALQLSRTDGRRHSASIARPTFRSATTRSSISSWRATSRRSSTTISPRRSPPTATATPIFPLPEPLDPGAGHAGHEPARRDEENVEVRPVRKRPYRPHRRRRTRSRRRSVGPRPTPSRCRARSRVWRAAPRPTIWSAFSPR